MQLIEVWESQALTFCGLYRDEHEYIDSQNTIEAYCSNMAETLMQNNMEYLSNETERISVKRALYSIGADKKHCDKLVEEAFYNQLIQNFIQLMN